MEMEERFLLDGVGEGGVYVAVRREKFPVAVVPNFTNARESGGDGTAMAAGEALHAVAVERPVESRLARQVGELFGQLLAWRFAEWLEPLRSADRGVRMVEAGAHDGKLAGEIFSDDVLIVGEGAEVSAEINVGAIVIEGTVHGNIQAKRSVEIRTPGRVRGNITTPSLFIEKGVIFDGHCQMEPNGPSTGKPRPSAAAVTGAVAD